MKVPTQDKRYDSVGWANAVFAHAEPARVQQVAHPTNFPTHAQRACALVLLCSLTLILTGGCGSQKSPNFKKSRTIAAENIKLRKELDLRNTEIETLKARHGKELTEQEKLLAECLKEKEALKEKSRQNIRTQVKGVLDTVLEENTKLREENTKLKAQIKELQKQPQ